MNRTGIFTILLFMLAGLSVVAADSPKREFRGAWINTIYQPQYKRNSTEQNKQYLVKMLDSLHQAGMNVILFQVRPQSDAFYASELEPWSRFLTDGGQTPQPLWDPLEFMIEEAHARGMELHAWLNPYRVTSNRKQTLPPNHIYHSHPERFVRYDGKLYFDPGIPENREFIGMIVDDIVARYDIDGIHLDDYFYPYPVAGKEFSDAATFRRYGNGMNRDEWRRHNVDILIEDLYRRIHAAKPWVRFGVSPFGIWRNKRTDPRGSETSGLQNYDALYADVLLWEQNGWVDYLIPQLYWELDHKAASSRILLDWWNENAGTNRHLYIGQDVSRCMDKEELGIKVGITRKARNIIGNCWWPAYAVTSNYKNAADSLTTVHQLTPALVPSYPWISTNIPKEIRNIEICNGRLLRWQAPDNSGNADDATRFVIYRFDSIDDIDIDNPEAIISITPQTSYQADSPGVYVITALSRANNESEPSIPVIIR